MSEAESNFEPASSGAAPGLDHHPLFKVLDGPGWERLRNRRTVVSSSDRLVQLIEFPRWGLAGWQLQEELLVAAMSLPTTRVLHYSEDPREEEDFGRWCVHPARKCSWIMKESPPSMAKLVSWLALGPWDLHDGEPIGRVKFFSSWHDGLVDAMAAASATWFISAWQDSQDWLVGVLGRDST